MKTFNDLIFKEHSATISKENKDKCIANGIDKDSDIFSEMLQAKMKFDNGHSISVIFGKMFYSNGIDTYEIWDSKYEDEPKGYLSKDEITEYMKKVQEL